MYVYDHDNHCLRRLPSSCVLAINPRLTWEQVTPVHPVTAQPRCTLTRGSLLGLEAEVAVISGVDV